MWVLGMRPGVLCKSHKALKPQTISPAPKLGFLVRIRRHMCLITAGVFIQTLELHSWRFTRVGEKGSVQSTFPFKVLISCVDLGIS